ncbi:MAG TPA: helix-turn-helix domain-containing protein [Chloroflexota bacterium]|nr:helix-turn-helix domain-containing protein [Chloroflexota bacterium]
MKITKAAVLDAATRLLAVNPGAATQEIAEAAGISRASLHRYFPTRDALVEAIAALAVERVTAAMAAARLDEGPALDAIARLTEAILPVVHQFAFLATQAQLPGAESLREKDRAVDGALRRLFQRGQAEGALRADLTPAWLLHAYGWLLYAAAVATRQGDIAPREAARLVLSTFLRGAARAPARWTPGDDAASAVP